MAQWLGLGLTRSRKSAHEEKVQQEVCCPLPFPLQDLCLLVIINNLGSYQKELLASLPLWLRRRLLNILPAFDLCRLEHTSVAAGVDVSAIWKSRPKSEDSVKSQRLLYLGMQNKSENSFQLNICDKKFTYKTHNSLLEEEVKSAFKDDVMDQSEFPRGKEILFSGVSDIFAKLRENGAARVKLGPLTKLSTGVNLDAVILRLISIESDFVFSNLLSGSMHESCQSSLCGQRVWKKQAAALAIHEIPQKPAPLISVGTEKICLFPYHHQLLSYLHDPLKLLSLLVRDCNLQPLSAYVDIDFIYNSMCSERLLFDSSLPPDRMSCTSLVHHILGKVIILMLKCDDYSTLGVMLGIVEAALENSQLKYLFCSMSNLYMDMVQPFSTLFSLQNFHQLTLDVDKLSPAMLCKLLYGFIIAPCLSTKKLIINVKHDVLLPTTSLQPHHLAGLYKGEPLPSPSCSAEHKVLEFSPQKEFTRVLYLLLQLPIIRLKEISLSSQDGGYEYLHLCTLHPNLQVAKFVVDMAWMPNASFLATVQADLISLFGMPSLRKIVISGNWGSFDGVKLGIIEGLHGRSRLLPLKKVALELASCDHYKLREFESLCLSIFSLPSLESLKLVLGKGFADMIRQPRFEEIVYKCWTCRASGVQLKSICLHTHDTDFKHLSMITQKLTFSYKARKREEFFPRDNMWLDFYCGSFDDYSYDYYDSDEYI